jgi:hypothetical protein
MRAADASLLIIGLVVAWSIYRAHRNPAYEFSFFDLLMDNGRLSRLAFVFMGSFLVSSWIMIRLTFDGKMSEGLFMAYGTVWVAPIIARLFSPPPTSSMTTTSSTQTVTTP